MDVSGEQTCITLYQYDKKGRRIKEILPLLAEKVYNYDGNDNMISFTDEEGQETTVCYDLNNRPTALAYSDGRTVSFCYNLRGDLVEMTDWNGTAAMERDILGRRRSIPMTAWETCSPSPSRGAPAHTPTTPTGSP